MADSRPAELPAQDTQDEAHNSTLAGRRQPMKTPPTLHNAQNASYSWDLQDEGELRSGQLRVVNETRERLDSDASILVEQETSSSVPYEWSASALAEDNDRKARWRDSVNSKLGTKIAIPRSFQEQATDVLIKIRLLPIMKTLKSTSDKDVLAQALKRAEAVLEYAVKEHASSATQGRCCYYIGVAKHLLDHKDALKYFRGALDAKGVYEEGRRAQQWINHYESMADLSPHRVAISSRPVSFLDGMYNFKDYLMGGRRKSNENSVAGVQVTTPVSKRFSLDIQDDYHESDVVSSNANRDGEDFSVAGGESIPSFTSWGSSSKTAQPTPASSEWAANGGSHSPRSVLSKTTALDSDVEKQGSLRDRRRSSIFNVNTVLKKVRELSISPTKSDEHLMEEGHSPFEPNGKEQSFY